MTNVRLFKIILNNICILKLSDVDLCQIRKILNKRMMVTRMKRTMLCACAMIAILNAKAQTNPITKDTTNDSDIAPVEIESVTILAPRKDVGQIVHLSGSEILITQKEDSLSGIAIAATLEGARPLLIETQALVTQSVYGTPQRTSSGFDLRRMQLLLAVLEKRGGFHFGAKDVFLNIAGGIKVEDPAIDLAVLCAILSSYEDKCLPHKICFVGEVGLSGEVRAVNRIEQRIAEAEKLGFEKIIISSFNQKGIDTKKLGISVVAVETVEEAYKLFFNA
jgi:hypothetical protein